MKPAAPVGDPKSEPKTSLGNFYRAHRTEVLAGGGILVAAIAYWKSKSSNAASSAQTSSSTSPTLAPSSTLPSGYGSGGGSGSSTGASTAGYGASNNSLLNQLLSTAPSWYTAPSTITTPPAPPRTSTSPPPVTTSPQPVTVPPGGTTPPQGYQRPGLAPGTYTHAGNLATTSQNLAKYRAQVAASPNAKNRAAVTALSHRLSVERTYAKTHPGG